jgi:hypothetical protein
MSKTPKTIKDRLMSRVETEGECLIWQGAKRPSGYGVIGVKLAGKHTVQSTHRIAYEIFNGPIPDGLHIDHMCSRKACVNPQHLRAVPQATNNQAMWDRGEREKVTHCKWGHEFTPENTTIHNRSGCRQCRMCRILRNRARRAGISFAALLTGNRDHINQEEV